MKFNFIVVIFITMLSTNAFAFHETNCSNADGSLKRVENEIWGANQITWTSGEQSWSDNFIEDFKLELKKTLVKPRRDKETGRTNETYAIKVILQVTVTASDGKHQSTSEYKDWVICKSWKDDKVD